MLFIWGLAETCTGLYFVLFQGLWVANQRYVIQGDLDRVMLRPLNPYLQILLDNLKPEDIGVTILGGAMMAYALQGLPPLSITQFLVLPLFIAGGVGILHQPYLYRVFNALAFLSVLYLVNKN